MILAIALGFIFGIWIGSFNVASWGFILALICISVLIYSFTLFMETEQKRVLFFVIIFLLGITIGLLRMHYSDHYQTSKLKQFENKSVAFSGIIVNEPDVREKNTMLTVLVQNAKVSSTTIPLSEKIIISTSLYPEFFYGDQTSFNAKLSLPKEIQSESGRVFDYTGYLRVRGVWYTASFVYPKLISKGHGSIIKSYLLRVKKSFTNAIDNALPQPQSSLMAGLLLGTKQSLGKQLLGEFNRAGVSHVVVLSGYNITIVAESIIAFFAFLPGAFSFVVGCLGIILFTVLAGGGASAIRAAIMVLVALFARKFGREYSAGKAFGLAVVVMLIWNPLLLVFDPSFQLSVLATIGIVFVSPYLEKYFIRITEKYSMREIVSSTISTQLIVLPFLIYNTGTLSLVSLPINVLILTTIPLTMLLGFLVGITGLVSLYLSFVPALFAYIFLWYQLAVVHIGASLSYGAINLPAFSVWIMVLVYVIIFLGLYFLSKKTAR